MATHTTGWGVTGDAHCRGETVVIHTTGGETVAIHTTGGETVAIHTTGEGGRRQW